LHLDVSNTPIARMRFLIVLALIKCAATQHGGHKTYSVIDPSNHKTVSVPIGNGMNVDIDVTVDVDTGGNKPKCAKKGWPCSPLKCCKGLKCKRSPGPWGRWGCSPVADDECTPAGQPCETSSECCEVPLQTMTCQESGYEKRCLPSKDQKCNASEGEYCIKDGDCCEKDNACKYENGRDRPICTYKPKDCIEDGEPCHGTDDWAHKCCSESCCEGKCGTCGYTPWYKRF